jgi:hypothetical protein
VIYLLAAARWGQRRRDKIKRREEVASANIGQELGKLVVEARSSARSVRRLTWALAGFAAISTAFVIYSAVR